MSGAISRPLIALQTMLAESATFQAWTSAANAAAALNSIHLVTVAEDALARPFAIVDLGDTLSLHAAAAGTHIPSGELTVYFEADVPDDITDAQALLAFSDQVGGVIADLLAVSGDGDRISIRAIGYSTAPTRSIDDREPVEGDFYRVELQIEHGV